MCFLIFVLEGSLKNTLANNNTKTAISYTKPNTTPQKTKGIFLFVYFLVCSLGLTLMRERGMATEDGRWKMEVEARSMWKKSDGEENEWENEPLLCSLCLSLPLLPLVSSEQAKARCTVFAESAERQQQHKR